MVLSLSIVSRAAYQPPPSEAFKGYERSPLTLLMVHKKDDARAYALNVFVVAVEINGHPTSLQVDTGGEHSGIGARFLFPLDLDRVNEHFNWQRQYANGMRVSGLNLQILRIGGVAYHNVPGMVATGETLEVRSGPSSGFSVAGLLGTDFLRDHDAVVDCAHRGLFLKVDPKAEVITDKLAAQGWTAVPIKVLSSGHLEVQGMINGYRGHFFIDTGAPFDLFCAPAAKRAKVVDTGHHRKANGIGVVDQHADIGRADQFVVGTYQAPAQMALVSDKWDEWLKMPGAYGPCLGLLGLSFLGENQAIIDYRTKTLYLRARPGAKS
ncbi:MAG: retroviral-like aspartic protease family protein [Chthoniobacteraceae bacterium]